MSARPLVLAVVALLVVACGTASSPRTSGPTAGSTPTVTPGPSSPTAAAAPAGSAPATGVYMAATTMTLTGIVIAQVGNGFAMRTLRQSIVKVGFFSNKMLLWGIAAELVFQAAIVYLPAVQAVFSTSAMSGVQWLVLAAFAPLLLIADEIRKIVLRNFWHRRDINPDAPPVAGAASDVKG